MSPASVSMVLSNAPGPSAATRERVLEAAAELGYRPDRTASLLARRRTHLVGVLMQVGSPFHAELVEDLHEAAERPRLRRRPERGDPHPRRAPGHRDAGRLPLRGPGPPRPGRPRRPAGRPGAAAAGGGDRAPGRRGRGRRGPVGRRRGGRPGRRPPGRAGAPLDRLRRRGQGDDRRRPPPRLPHGHAPPRPGRPRPGHRRRPHRGGRQPGRPGRSWTSGALPERGGRLQRLLRPRAAGRLQPGRGRGPRGGLGGRLRRQQPGPARPRQPDHGQPGRPGPGRARGGRGRGAPGRRPGAAPRGRARAPAWSSGAPPARRRAAGAYPGERARARAPGQGTSR